MSNKMQAKRRRRMTTEKCRMVTVQMSGDAATVAGYSHNDGLFRWRALTFVREMYGAAAKCAYVV